MIIYVALYDNVVTLWRLSKEELGWDFEITHDTYADSKVHGTNMGTNWVRQDTGGPHVGPMNFAIWVWDHFWTTMNK